jgi:hypothetical protein
MCYTETWLTMSQFFCFLIMHLWCYDKFNCVRWDSGRQPGAFKRVMTVREAPASWHPVSRCVQYSYLTTLPLLVCFSVAITVLKFREGMYCTPSTGANLTTSFQVLWSYRPDIVRCFDMWCFANINASLVR